MNMELTKSQLFIKEYKKKLQDGANFFNPDTAYQPVENYDSAKLRVLIIFPSPSSVKSVSTTKEAINDYILAQCPGVFVDFAFMPESGDGKLYDDARIPYCLGTITHLDASHFDVVGFSISVLSDSIAACTIINTFSRCDKPIPLTWTERKDLPLGSCPIIEAGGITAACGDIMYGNLGDGRQAFMDFTYLGAFEDKNTLIFNRLAEALQTGKVTRSQEDHAVIGYAEEIIPDFQEVVEVKTNQDFIEACFDLTMVYQPQAYEVKFDDAPSVISNKKINSKARDFVRPYYPHEMSDMLGIGRTLINASGANAGVSQVQVSEGCSAGGQCSFCSEGCYTGGWVEKPREVILDHVRTSKKYSAGYKFKPFSFNCNYVTDYKGLLKELLQIFPKVTFLNMRMEELGRDTDAIKMMKLVGSNRMSAPIEGLSPRIQNNLLNKCLSEESLYNFMEDMVHMRLTDIKVGGIFTGYEEDQDFQWICDFVDGFKKKAKDEMGNFPFRLKVTPLVHYQLTACEYLERKSARKSYLGEHWLTDEWYDKFREHNVFFKVNGFRYSTFLEQCIIDLGRFATPIVYNLIVKQNLPVYSLRSIAKDNIIDAFKNSINPDKFFEARDPDKYISLSHRIHIDLMGSYIPRARRLVRAYKAGNIFDNEMDIRCLKTFDGAITKCYARCAAKDPLKIYNDVELVDGKLVGNDPHLLLGCERCQTNELRLARLKRPTPQTATSEDIIALPRIPKIEKIRFIISRNEEYDVLNPNNTAHTFIAKMLQKSDNLLSAFHSVEGHNLFWQSDPENVYYTAGYQIVDTWWSKRVLSEVRDLIPELNNELKSLRIVSAKSLVEGDKLDCNDINIFKFETSIPSVVFDASYLAYKGDVRIDLGMGQSELRQDKSLIPPVYISKDKIYGYFACPAKYNPLNYLSGFFAGRTYTVNKIASLTKLQCVMTVRENKAICSACGKEKAVYNLLTDKPYQFGKSCLIKALLKQL